jgi:electron-transferring-flavoprotein dehydrogenase
MTTPRQYSLNLPGVERETLEVDVLLVGAGAANLACAIHLARLLAERGIEGKSILVLEKAGDIGDHTLSGAVMNPRGMEELFPDWRERGCPVESDVKWDGVEILYSPAKSKRLTGPLVPPQFQNHGNVIVSMNKVVRWMKDQAEAAGVQVYPGFAAAEILFEGEGAAERVAGVVTRDSGIGKQGQKKENFQPGMNVRATATVFGEGTRGHLVKHLVKRHALDANSNPQMYGTGVKEIWEIPAARGAEWQGGVLHTAGYPLGTVGYGGSFVYGLPGNRLALGFVIGLDHPDAKLDPHALFVRWKQHPSIQAILAGGKVLGYGAKTVPEGGYWSMPRLYGESYVLVGDSAGFLNAATLKGVHLAIKSGMLAAEALADALAFGDTSAARLARYQDLFSASWAKDELYGVRNFRQSFESGLVPGMLDAGLQMVSGGRGLHARRHNRADHQSMQPLQLSKLEKPGFDDTGSMDKLTDVYHSGTVHDEDQPAHLLVKDTSICVERCTREFGNPCQHFCPAAVYEWPGEGKPKGPTVNFANCVHCKTCDIADPYENIEWVVPEGGGGPKYADM